MAKKVKIDLMHLLIIAAATGAGAVGATKLNQIPIPKDDAGNARTLASLDGKLRGGLKVAAGAAAPLLAQMLGVKDKTTLDAISAIGSGIVAVGALEGANSFIEDRTKKLAISGLPRRIGSTLDFTETYYNPSAGMRKIV